MESIFNKKLYKTYKDYGHLEPENIRKVLYEMRKKYSSKFSYYITKSDADILYDILYIRIYGNIYKHYIYYTSGSIRQSYFKDKCFKINNFLIINLIGEYIINKYKNNKLLCCIYYSPRIDYENCIQKMDEINKYIITDNIYLDNIIKTKILCIKQSDDYIINYEYINYYIYITKGLLDNNKKSKNYYNYRVAILFFFVRKLILFIYLFIYK